MAPSLTKYYKFRQRLFPNQAGVQPKSGDPDPVTFWNFADRMLPYVGRLYSAPHRKINWSLTMLAVDPKYQGRGIGRSLVEEGFQRARTDPEGDLPVVVASAEGKEDFYRKCGFTEMVGYLTQEGGDANPLKQAGMTGLAVLWSK
jgi:GNAT superfamily N-acetyltransferase